MTVQFTADGKYNKPDFNHLNWHTEWQAMMDILDEAIHGTNKIDVTAADVTPTIPDGATGTGRHKVIEFFGTAGVSRNATFPTVEGFWIFKNTSDDLVVVKMAAGLTVTLGRDRIALVYSDATDMIEILQFQLKSTEFGETLGYLTDKSWRYEFQEFDHHLWVQFQSDAANVVLDRDDDDDIGFPSQYGKGYVRFTAQTAYRFKFLLPFNPNVLYRIRFVLRQRTDGTAGQNKIFLGVAAHKFDGTVIGVDGTSGETFGNLHSVAAHNKDLEGLGSYQEFTGYFKGQSASPTAQETQDIRIPGDLHSDARFFSPMFWVNENNTNGLVDVAMIQIDEVPEEGPVLAPGSNAEVFNELTRDFDPADVNITTDKITETEHGYPNGTATKGVQFTTTGALPGGLSLATTFYLVNAAADDYQVALTPGGVAIDLTSQGTGTHTIQHFFVPPKGVSRVFAEAYGGGGGGGGSEAPIQAGSSGGSGGGAGGVSEGFFTVVPAVAEPITVGAGGAGGVPAVSGSPGSDTTFKTLAALSGSGGERGIDGTSGQGGDGGNASGGIINSKGGGGGGANRVIGGTVEEGLGGKGGETKRGHSGSSSPSSVDGLDGTGFGSGGGGAGAPGVATVSGGAGSDGAVIIFF